MEPVSGIEPPISCLRGRRHTFMTSPTQRWSEREDLNPDTAVIGRESFRWTTLGTNGGTHGDRTHRRGLKRPLQRLC